MEEDQREHSPPNLSSFSQPEISGEELAYLRRSALVLVGDWGEVALRRILTGVGLVVTLQFGLPFSWRSRERQPLWTKVQCVRKSQARAG